MADPSAFDRAYYQRYYHDPRTRVGSPQSVQVLADFVCAFLRHVGQPVRRVLDMGCGLGHWRDAVLRHYPKARYTGVEYSEYLCDELGWTHGSAVDFSMRGQADLVICQGVLQYLERADCRRAIDNLATLTRGALYLEVLTERDWQENCDREATDGNVHLRSGAWYRGLLARHFVNYGGGMFLAHGSPATLFELEHLEGR